MCRMSWYEGYANCESCCHYPCFCKEEWEEVYAEIKQETAEEIEEEYLQEFLQTDADVVSAYVELHGQTINSLEE